MTAMNKNVFTKKSPAFKGQCMCPVNCTTKKCESTSADVKTDVKKAYSK